MSAGKCKEDSAAQGSFRFWTPTEGRVVLAGAERHAVPLPQVPLPLHPSALVNGEPTDDAVGSGLYDYLRHFPDCKHNRVYAELLKDAYPHYIADLAAMIVMLDHKEVDAPYVQRKVSSLKILALLDPDNVGLQLHLGLCFLDLGLTFNELNHCRSHLLSAMKHLQRVVSMQPDDASSLNALSEIDYLFGDYPAAARNWRRAAAMLGEGESALALLSKAAAVEESEPPDHPLVDELEAIGEAMELHAAGEVRQALEILERLEEQGRIVTEFPSAQFYLLLGSCRQACGETAGAFDAYERALALDPALHQAEAARESILSGGRR